MTLDIPRDSYTKTPSPRMWKEKNKIKFQVPVVFPASSSSKQNGGSFCVCTVFLNTLLGT